MIHSTVTYSPTYDRIPIMTDPEKGYGCYESILEKTKQLLDGMLSKHRVLFCRVDIHFPSDYVYTNTNAYIQRFFASFTKHLRRKSIASQYIWVQEQQNSHNPHYHCILLFSYENAYHLYPHLQYAQELWSVILGLQTVNRGLLHLCPCSSHGGRKQFCISLDKNSYYFEDEYERAFRASSYLSKLKSKNNISPFNRAFSSSQVKKYINSNTNN